LRSISQKKLTLISALTNISTIIFDLGGVILDLNVNRSVKAFAEFTNLSNKEIYSRFQEGWWARDFEKGDISPEKFRNEIRRSLNSNLTDKQVDDSWNAMLAGVPIDRLKLVNDLRPKYNTLVLSNTNAIHLKEFNNLVSSTTRGGKIRDYFDRVYYSHELGMRKPDKEIFAHIIDENKLTPEETLFIDDMDFNISGAESVGLKTLHLTDQNYLSELFA
jgi:epoxide hydrolase-like predicted phosphatase